MIPNATPLCSDGAPAGRATLTELVAQSRWPRNPKALELAAHREELLQLRRAGESVAAIGAGLRKLGVAVSDEALRLWLNRELGHKPNRRRKARVDRDVDQASVKSAVVTSPERTSTTSSAATTGADPVEPDEPPAGETHLTDHPSSLILPGETPLEAFRRRLAALRASNAEVGGVN